MVVGAGYEAKWKVAVARAAEEAQKQEQEQEEEEQEEEQEQEQRQGQGQGQGQGQEEQGQEEQKDRELTDDSGVVVDESAARKLLRSASVVVGLHPDQATGALLQLALATGAAFAIVPCCVYSAEFKRRRLCDGTPVKSYEQLVAWLRETADAAGVVVEEARLDMQGKNRVVFSHGRRGQEPAPG